MKLAEDGIVGPKTLGAVCGFQEYLFGWKDGRIDPDGPTLRALNCLAGVTDAVATANPSIADILAHAQDFESRQKVERVAQRPPLGRKPRQPTPADHTAELMAHYRLTTIRLTLLPQAQAAIKSGLLRLDRCWDFVTRVSGAGGLPSLDHPDRLSFLLFNKHFHVGHATGAQGAVERVRGLVREMDRVFARGPYLWGASAFVAVRDQPKAPDLRQAGGYGLEAGGFHRPGRKINGERVDAIYLPPVFDSLSLDTRTFVLIHELAHFAGPAWVDRPSSAIMDFAYSYEPRYWTLSAQLAQHNAEGYSAFLYENFVGTVRADAAALASGLYSGHSPIVNPNGQIVPPASST